MSHPTRDIGALLAPNTSRDRPGVRSSGRRVRADLLAMNTIGNDPISCQLSIDPS
jgi:hypothetical protein